MTIKTRVFINEECARFAMFLDAYGILYENEGKWFKLRGYSYGRMVPGKPCHDGVIVACVEPDKGKWLRGSGILYVYYDELCVVADYFGLDGDYSTANFCDGGEMWDGPCFSLCEEDRMRHDINRTRAEMAQEVVTRARSIRFPVSVKGRGESVEAGALAWCDKTYLWVDDENPWPEATLMSNNP